MSKFAVGDKVVRVGSDFYVMKIGDVGTVSKSWVDFEGEELIYLEESEGSYYAKNFKLAEETPTFKAMKGMFQNMKFKVSSPEQSKEIQEALFSMGYGWEGYGKSIMFSEECPVYDWLYTDVKGNLFRIRSYDYCKVFSSAEEHIIETTKSYKLIPVATPKDTITIDGKTYDKEAVLKRLAELEEVK